MLTAITFAAKRGVDVRIILPHIPDKKYVYVLAQSDYKRLLDAGVKVYEYTPGFVHAKVFVSDNERAVVGTINLDYRSLYWHYECSAYLYRVPAIADIYKDFINTQSKCQRVTPESVKEIGVFSRMAAYALKIVAPLL
jgi:cardiolipin synthase